MKTSGLYSLDFNDLIKGLIVAVIGAVINTIKDSITAGTFNFNWEKIGTVALVSGLAYLSKNFFTGSKIVLPN